MDASVILESTISLFLIILVGVYASKKGIITPEINKGLVVFLIQISLPFMILSSFIYTYDDTIQSNVIKTTYYSLIAYVIIIIFSYFLLIPINDEKKTIWHFANVFTNTGYVGFPILHALYGPEGVVYGSIFNMFFVIFVWTYGISLFKGNIDKEDLKDEIKKILLNPSIIALYFGLLIMIFNISLPGALVSGIKAIGNITAPLSMIIIGVVLSHSKIKKFLKDWTLYYGIIAKLILIPMAIYLVSLWIPGPSKVINTIIIMSAMPASAMTSIFAEIYGKEKEYAAVVVSITTLLSLASSSILIHFLL